MYYNDIYNCMEPGSVGSPVQGLQIKLEGWDGGGYSIFDKDGPKGEIHVGGERVSTGYFEQRGFTRANFYEIEGKIWNKTGDIGWEQKNGTFRIIDRKRDLINLQSEELVSLSKVQSVLSGNSLVHQCCAIARSTENFLCAIIVPNWPSLGELITDTVSDITKDDLVNDVSKRHKFQVAVCKKEVVIQLVCKTLQEWCIKRELNITWVPRRILLEPNEWLPISDLVSRESKIKRREIEAYYKEQIDYMYRQIRKAGKVNAI